MAEEEEEVEGRERNGRRRRRRREKRLEEGREKRIRVGERRGKLLLFTIRRVNIIEQSKSNT